MKITQKISGAALALSLALCSSYGFSGGEGTEENPWLISTPQELASLSQYTGEAGAGKYFSLSNDITFSEADFAAGGDFYNEGKLWAPIGTSENDPFRGHLNGRNFTISGLKINRSGEANVGLFGVISGSTIRDLVIIYASQASSVDYTGGLSAIAESATALNVKVKGSLSTSDTYGDAGGIFGNTRGETVLSSCAVEGTISGNYSQWGNSASVGGLVGKNNGPLEVNYCQVDATINNTYTGGGIIGYDCHNSQITGCQVTGEITGTGYLGGIIGNTYYPNDYPSYSNVIENCSVALNITGSAPANYGSSMVGGMIGYTALRYITVRGCNYTGNLYANVPAGEACLGGIIGVATSCIMTIENCRSSGKLDGTVRSTGYTWLGLDTVYAGGIVGFAKCNTVWGPVVVKSCYASTEITGNSVANITAGGLFGALIGGYYNANKLVDEIVGCGSDGKITATGTGSTSYQLRIGGLIGRLEQVNLTDCYAMNDISVSSSPVYSLGSLVGAGTSAHIRKSHALGNIEVTPTSYRNGFLGGILGKNTGSTVSQCVALSSSLHGAPAPDEAGPQIHRIASGDATGLSQNYARSDMVKLAGETPVPSIDDLNGPDGLGKTAEELASQKTYEALGWDFQTTWKMDVEGYPMLTWKLPDPSPVITEQPLPVTVTVGENATFSVTATGAEPLSYQWYKDGTAIERATEAEYTVDGATPNDAGEYTVHVTNEYGTKISDAALLTVVEPPTIVTQPSSATILVGEDYTFSVTVSGTPPFRYQWYKYQDPIIGAESATYTIENATVNDAGIYLVVVWNDIDEIVSEPAILTVIVPEPPIIEEQPVSRTILVGENATFSVSAAGTEPLSYQWFKDGTAIERATESEYTVDAATPNDAGTYTVRVTNQFGEVTSEPALLTVIEPVAPAITEQPASADIKTGETVTFSVTATGTAPLNYQWFKDGYVIESATEATHTIENATPNHTGNYTVRVTNKFGEVTSEPAHLSVTDPVPAPVITTQPQTLIVGTGSAATFAVVAEGQDLTYQWFLNGEEIKGANQSVYALAATSSADSGTYTVKVSNEGGEVTSQPASLWLNDLLMYAGINVYGPIGAEFVVEYTLTPGDPKSWQELSKGVINTLPTVVIDYDSPKDAKRFYRVILK